MINTNEAYLYQLYIEPLLANSVKPRENDKEREREIRNVYEYGYKLSFYRERRKTTTTTL